MNKNEKPKLSLSLMALSQNWCKNLQHTGGLAKKLFQTNYDPS